MTTYLINHLRIPGGVPKDEGLEYLESVEATFKPYGAKWLVLDAADLVAVEPEENVAVIAALRTAQPGWRLDPPAEFPLALDGDGYLRTRPDRHGADAFTAVRLRRAGAAT